jgi:GNAT superfamily N-acetyltransferase
MAAWQMHRLSRAHDRVSFDCGNDLLNEWIQQRAGQWERKELARCYVAVRTGESHVLGYYAISSHHVNYEALPDDQAKGLPRIDVPVVLLGRLAVDRSAQGQGLGQLLLVDALRRAEHLAQQLGIRAVEVDAIDDEARRFYAKFGFTPLLDDQNHLFLPMHIIHKLHLPPLHRS